MHRRRWRKRFQPWIRQDRSAPAAGRLDERDQRRGAEAARHRWHYRPADRRDRRTHGRQSGYRGPPLRDYRAYGRRKSGRLAAERCARGRMRNREQRPDSRWLEWLFVQSGAERWRPYTNRRTNRRTTDGGSESAAEYDRRILSPIRRNRARTMVRVARDAPSEALRHALRGDGIGRTC